MPANSGHQGDRILISGASVLSMDPSIGDFATADVLIEGTKIVQIAQKIEAVGAQVIDARGMIAIPGFVDTHHHLHQTALRGTMADSLLIGDGSPATAHNYMDFMMGQMLAQFTPEDVWIAEHVGRLSQLDAGVTTVMDTSQIHHSQQHSDAAVAALRDSGGRSVLTYCPSAPASQQDARRLRTEFFSSDDQLVTMAMGGETLYPDWELSWQVGRDLGLKIACHVVGPFGMLPFMEVLAQDRLLTEDHILIHMTRMSDAVWNGVAESGASVSLAVPTEMSMGQGAPPVQRAYDLGITMSLSTDVESALTADPFTLMRSTLTYQRFFANEQALSGTPSPSARLTSRDVLGFATLGGAKTLGLDAKIGTLTPGKEADIVLLNATSINAAPLNNVPGAVVTLMERSNVDTVIVGGAIRKWRGALVGVDTADLSAQLGRSRDRMLQGAGVSLDLFD
jgi:cytosine/adenosine deaminase-related metal-dependent hydrolase